jgi:hypothetical protein
MAFYTNTKGVMVEADLPEEAQTKIVAEVNRIEAEKNNPKKQEQKTIEAPKLELVSGKKELTEEDGK